MERRTFLGGLAATAGAPLVSGIQRLSAQVSDPPKQLKKLASFASGNSDLYVWTDTANSYVLRDGDRALLFDLGDGSVLDALTGIGVSRVEWVLFTNHHREHVQGSPLLAKWHPQIAVAKSERAFLENKKPGGVSPGRDFASIYFMRCLMRGVKRNQKYFCRSK